MRSFSLGGVICCFASTPISVPIFGIPPPFHFIHLLLAPCNFPHHFYSGQNGWTKKFATFKKETNKKELKGDEMT
jgi:hypothetical protein